MISDNNIIGSEYTYHIMSCTVFGNTDHNHRTCSNACRTMPNNAADTLRVSLTRTKDLVADTIGHRRIIELGVELFSEIPLDSMFHELCDAVLPVACARRVYERARDTLTNRMPIRTATLRCYCPPEWYETLHDGAVYCEERSTPLFALINLPISAVVLAHVDAFRASARARMGTSAECLVLTPEQALVCLGETRDRENYAMFNTQELLIADVMQRIINEERALWNCDELLADVLRKLCGLGISEAGGWICSREVIPLDVPALRRNDE